jgi:hypothetical protein
MRPNQVYNVLLKRVLHLTRQFSLGYDLYDVNLQLAGTNTYGGIDRIPGY